MLRYVLKRFLLTLPALWLVLTLVFLMIHIMPGDPVEQMLGECCNSHSSPWLSAPRLRFIPECAQPIGAARRPIALPEG
jgi:ABC-type microcin C transport system permease subunit YejB